MNTPFSQPNLANFIKTGTDAAVSKVTFPDGTSQTTAAGGGAPGFTPVNFVARFTTEQQIANNRAVVPDTIIINEGITSGNGSDGTPYGWSELNDSISSFKVSEEMAGLYQISNIVCVSRYGTANGLRTPDFFGLNVNAFLLGQPGGNNQAVITPRAEGVIDVNSDNNYISNTTAIFRLTPEMRFQIAWGSAFTLNGRSANSPGGQISIVKLSD